MKSQVERKHYDFHAYMTPYRWMSLWHQANLVLGLEPDSVVEIGGGLGFLSQNLESSGVALTSVDVAEDLRPDVVASADALPFEDGAFDVACAFQVLEHLPYEQFIPSLNELMRVTKKGVVISLPDNAKAYPIRLSFPRVGVVDFILPRPYRKLKHSFDGEHYWEINKKETPLKQVLKDIGDAGFNCTLQRRFADNLYHRFFILKK